MELFAGIGALNAAISIAKSVIQADQAIDSASLKAKLAEMMCELANAKISQTELVEEIHKLKAELSRIHSAESDLTKLKELDGYHYQCDPEGSPIGWPACPKCKDKEKRISILIQHGDETGAKCPRCDSEYRPVTSFVSPGYTRLQKKRDDRARRDAETNAAIQRNRRDWMA